MPPPGMPRCSSVRRPCWPRNGCRTPVRPPIRRWLYQGISKRSSPVAMWVSCAFWIATRPRRGALSLDREGRPVTATLAGWPDASQAPPPEGYGALVAMAERLSARLPWLLRLDFYLTPRGPVFGEVTTFPNAGLRYTPFARRTILQMWELWPD